MYGLAMFEVVVFSIVTKILHLVTYMRSKELK